MNAASTPQAPEPIKDLLSDMDDWDNHKGNVDLVSIELGRQRALKSLGHSRIRVAPLGDPPRRSDGPAKTHRRTSWPRQAHSRNSGRYPSCE